MDDGEIPIYEGGGTVSGKRNDDGTFPGETLPTQEEEEGGVVSLAASQMTTTTTTHPLQSNPRNKSQQLAK